jgi:hypothetical protein
LSYAAIRLKICRSGLPKTRRRALAAAGRSKQQQEGGQPMLTSHSRNRLWQTPTGYAASHCTTCAMGWTRTGTEGGQLTICLLDREPVLLDMKNCDRFEPKDAAKA